MNSHPRFDALRAGLWALTGAVVVLFIFFAALGGIDPGTAWVATIVIAVLAVLWIVHFLRRRATVSDGLLSRADRERRGF